MPVGFGKISANLKAFVSKGRENLLRNVRFWICGERRTIGSNFVIRLVGVKHSKSVVVFCSKNYVFHSSCFCRISPFLRIEINGIECFLKVFIILYIFIVCFSMFWLTLCPTFVFWAYTPTFNYSPLAVGSPMHK